MTYVPFKPEDPGYGDLRVASDVRNNLNALFNGDHSPLRARAQATPDMTLQIAGCDVEGFFKQCWIGITAPFNFAGGNSPTITAPSANPRIALLTIDASGTLLWTYGEEATSPVAPNCPEEKIPICYVYEKTTMAKIVNFEDAAGNPNEGYIYRDVRPFLNLGGGQSAVPATNFMSYDKKFASDGSDGDVTISVNTTLSSSGVGVKVMRYNNLTVNSGVYLEAASDDKVLVILVKGTLTINGTIRMNTRGGAGGGHGNGGAGGAFGGGGGGDYNGGGLEAAGGGGGGGEVGQDAINNDTPGQGGGTWGFYSLGGGSKGHGGAGGTNGVGAGGGKFYDTPLSPVPFIEARTLSGGGGGGGGGGAQGGNGGKGGGVIWIEAKEIVWGASGIVSANGGNGSGGSTLGGGGAGGGGGFVQIGYQSKTGTSTIQVSGGSGGSGGVTGWAGGAGISGVYGEFQVE